MINYFIILSLFLDFSQNNDWVYLFNGKDLEGWQVKIKNHKLGDNYNNTFKVSNGYLKGLMKTISLLTKKFGHIFISEKNSKNYHLSLTISLVVII